MNPSKYAFPAGLFILLAAGAALYLVSRVADARSAIGDAHQYVATFPAGEDISGLSVGSEVRLLGVKVGRIDAIDWTPAEPDGDASVQVTFSVPKTLELRAVDAHVELQAAVTGGAWLNILSVGKGAALADGASVQGRTSNLLAMVGDVRDEMQATLADVRTDLDEVGTELIDTVNAIEDSAREATTLIAKIDGQIDPVVAEVDTFLAEATGVMTDIRGVFGDSGEDIRTTLANIESLTTKLDTHLPQTLSDIQGFVGSTEGFIARAEASLDGADGLIDELTGTAADARALLATNRPAIDRTIASARRSVDELEGLIDDLRANPSRLIWPPDEKDLKNLELYATARAYANAAEDLQSAAAALREASLNQDADPEQLNALRDDLMRQFEHFDKLQEEVWSRFER